MNSIFKLLPPYLFIFFFFVAAFSFYKVVYSKVKTEPNRSVSLNNALSGVKNDNVSIEDDALLLAAPPRSKKDQKTFPPITDWISRELGVNVKYVQSSGWDRFDHDLVREKYDIVFGGPHYVQYLHKNFDYDIIVKLPNAQQWTVITRANSKVKKIKQLAGKSVCVQGVRNFARLVLFNVFENQPARLPIPIEIDNRETGFNHVVSGKCVATIISTVEYETYTKKYIQENTQDNFSTVRLPVVRMHTFNPNPNQAFVISQSVSAKYKDKIVELLLSETGQEKMQLLRNRWSGGKPLISARNDEYNMVDNLLLSSPVFSTSY